MEERGNKTIMCSVLFLDIVEYSKKSVSGQISLKDRFNTYLSTAIRDVPMTDRIILDTGDGAAINFLGDVEDALKAALSLRESLLNEAPDTEPPLLIRMGINLGPVRLVRDINGQPNIVGDGINVAQRVMGFADASQILVSRSYYDAVSRLSPQYAEMFHYQGSRTDKHVREHEVYAIGYPGDQTSVRAEKENQVAEPGTSQIDGALKRMDGGWHSISAKLDEAIQSLNARYKAADSRKRALFVFAVGAPLILLSVLTVKLAHRGEATVAPAVVAAAPSVSQPASTEAAPAPAPAKETVADKTATEQSASTPARKADEQSAAKAAAAKKAAESKAAKDKDKAKRAEVQPKPSTHDAPSNRSASAAANEQGAEAHVSEGHISVSCIDGTQLFVDGAQKGKITSGSLSVTVVPGKHTVIVTHPSKGVFSQTVELDAGKTVRLKPGFCD
ncbi:MAG TPA: adenylate/guanylate cyclase domain-containing protein [Gallionella sp.]|nr:adenylate/guanylate cyclase domain-containing protein [Gallionella sp.]